MNLLILPLTKGIAAGNFRLFLEDGTELKNVIGISVEKYGLPTTVTVEFLGVELVEISEEPK